MEKQNTRTDLKQFYLLKIGKLRNYDINNKELNQLKRKSRKELKEIIERLK
jgi:hypothetical protein